jgi:hypothetical protein
VRVHRPREHALELEALDLAVQLAGVALDLGNRARLALRLGELEQLKRADDAVADPVEAFGDAGKLRPLAAERLRPLGAVPDSGIL